MQAQQEVDEVLGDRQQPNMQDYAKLKYVMRCVNESMRLYPHPPVLLRRAMVQDELPGTVHASCLCSALALQPIYNSLECLLCSHKMTERLCFRRIHSS